MSWQIENNNVMEAMTIIMILWVIMALSDHSYSMS